MDSIKNIFQHKVVNFEKLTAYGFCQKTDIHSYNTTLSDSGFIPMADVLKQCGSGKNRQQEMVCGSPYGIPQKVVKAFTSGTALKNIP